MRHIRNVYAEPVALLRFRNGDRVVEVFRIPAVNREDDVLRLPQIQSAVQFLFGDAALFKLRCLCENIG